MKKNTRSRENIKDKIGITTLNTYIHNLTYPEPQKDQTCEMAVQHDEDEKTDAKSKKNRWCWGFGGARNEERESGEEGERGMLQ